MVNLGNEWDEILKDEFESPYYQKLREFLKVAVPCGLLGMETIYSTYSQEESDLAKQIATEYGILQSGGSDFHGENKPSISLGTGKGNLQIPYEFYLNLKSKQQN